MKRAQFTCKEVLDELECTHGSMGLDPLTIALGFYLYIHDAYGVESRFFRERLYKVGLRVETIALDIARSDATKRFFRRHGFPPNTHYLHGIEVDTRLGLITFVLS